MPAATIRVTNATSGKLSLVGDNGKPRVAISAVGGSNYKDINMTSVVGNILLCDTLSSWITSAKAAVTRGGVTITADQMTAMKSAMTVDIYDSNLDGLSDKAEQLDFANATDVDDTASPYTILTTDDLINADVSGGVLNLLLPAVAAVNEGRVIIISDVKGNAGTNNITITPDGTDKIDGVNAAIILSANYGIATLRSSGGADGWYSDRAEIGTALAHATSNGNSHSNVVLNNTHRASDGSDHTFIDQDVTNAAAPVFAVTNMTGSAAGLDSDATAHAAADGSSHTFLDQSVVSGAAPVFAVTNMTGSAAGLDSDATAHAAADGSSHTFIDQDVTNAAAPVFAVTNMTGSAAGIDSDATAHAAADGSSHTFIDQDVTNASSPVFAVTNMTGSAAGIDSNATTHAASNGDDHSKVARSDRIKVTGLAIDTLNNEQSTAIGGSAGDQFVPLKVILHMEAVGGAGAAGDTQITIGTSSGGTQILAATPLTGLDALNDHFVIDLPGLTAAILANATIYVKVTTADTTAGAGHLADAYIMGEMFASGA